jgi:hypothetical protein
MRKRIKHKNVVGGVVANHRQPDGVETIANRSLGLGGAQRLEREKSPGTELATGLGRGA